MTTFLNEPFVEKEQGIGVLESRILRTLLYFDIFHHPLRADEIGRALSMDACSEIELQNSLKILVSKGLIYDSTGYYSLQETEALVSRRLAGEKYSQSALHTAKKFSKIIAAFPFVRGICLSGSISKGYMDETTDIDYFIITSPGRLWLCRTLLAAFKKVFLLNSRKNFCINYFVDTKSLLIPDQNIFTATELVSLIPTYNHSVYLQILQTNSWVTVHYPQLELRDSTYCIKSPESFLKRLSEKIFSGWIGQKLDAFCFQLTLAYWRKKFKHLDGNTFDLRLRSRKNVSKHHPNGFQERILSAYRERIHQFEEKYLITLR